MRSKKEEFMKSKAREYIMARRKRDVMEDIKHCRGVALNDRISNAANLDYINSHLDSLKEELLNA